jgi:hypothetical protein
MKAYRIAFAAAAFIVAAGGAHADNVPLGSEQYGSPMDFIIHTQPDKYPHHLASRSATYTSSAPQRVQAVPVVPSAAEVQWMERASRGGEAK